MATNQSRTKQAPSETVLKVPCEVYSRVVGYLRPVQNWHQGKQQEFKDRRTFRVDQVPSQEAPQQT